MTENLQALNHIQIFGASLTILGGVLYGRSRQAIELEAEERKSLLPRKWVKWVNSSQLFPWWESAATEAPLRLIKKVVMGYAGTLSIRAKKGKKNKKELYIHTG